MQKCRSEQMPINYVVPKPIVPDFWVEPKIIVEIAADEITKSPIHTAGYALRFPRLINFRDDKKIEDITTTKEVEQMNRF
jgi:DNA ligase-1